MTTLSEQWRSAFFETIRQHEHAAALQAASRRGQLGQWTTLLTDVVVAACQSLSWRASAKGHKLELLPVPRHEYLSQDVMAFTTGDKRWRFPVAVMELENRRELDFIAYSLWKVLCVRADLRVVYCYRQHHEDVTALVRFLEADVVGSMQLGRRVDLTGETLLVVGNRAEVEVFPYGFFKWWVLEKNTGRFKLI
ncbi:MAG: hypothetical protein Kow0031_26040 [Anaerolineae bacterium]